MPSTISGPSVTDATGVGTGTVWGQTFQNAVYAAINAIFSAVLRLGSHLLFEGANRNGGVAYINSATSGLARVSLAVGSTASTDPGSVNYNRPLTVFDAVSLADTATIDLPGGSALSGFLWIYNAQDAVGALFVLRGAVSTTTDKPLESQASIYANVSTASRIGVFWNAGTASYRIENRRGAARTLTYTFMGFGL